MHLLPGSIKLAANPKENIWDFYQIPCKAFIHDLRIHFVCNIPLIRKGIQIINTKFLPLAAKHENAGALQMSQSAPRFAISLSNGHYSVLGQEQESAASWTPFSDQLPCEVALNVGKTDLAEKNCKIVIATDFHFPVLKQIGSFHWAVSLEREGDLHLVCEGRENRTIKMHPPVFTFVLDENCEANNEHFNIPKFQTAKSNVVIEEEALFKIKNINTSFLEDKRKRYVKILQFAGTAVCQKNCQNYQIFLLMKV